MSTLPNIVTVAEAAKELKIKRQRLYLLIDQGRIETTRFMGRIVIEIKELNRFKRIKRKNGRPKGRSQHADCTHERGFCVLDEPKRKGNGNKRSGNE